MRLRIKGFIIQIFDGRRLCPNSKCKPKYLSADHFGNTIVNSYSCGSCESYIQGLKFFPRCPILRLGWITGVFLKRPPESMKSPLSPKA